ncbi:Protein TRANSPARENT TESTA 12 [Hordeum vulgare]|nr:Protein TRANSPARENT TESTA 12 [Hordeum vulgare]
MRPRLYDLLPGASLFALAAFSTPLPAAVLPRARSSSRYCGIRARPSGVYYTNMRYGPTRFGLRTFEISQAAPRAYDAAAWRLGRPRTQMNPRSSGARGGASPHASATAKHYGGATHPAEAGAPPPHRSYE